MEEHHKWYTARKRPRTYSLPYIYKRPSWCILTCLKKLFADDAKLYSTVENNEKELALQNQVTRSENWAAIWRMFFNILKCHHLHIGNLDTEFKYEMTTSEGKAVIEQVKSECDLGVTVDSRLKFRDHINKKVSIANRNLGIIFRTFTYIDKEMFLNLFKSMVRPHLEYGSPIWSLLYKKDKVIIENVQRRGTRMVKSLKDLPYEARLRELGLPTLEYRRERADQIQVYKILHGIDNIETEKFFTISSYTQTRGHSLKIFKKRARLNVRKNCFSNTFVVLLMDGMHYQNQL